MQKYTFLGELTSKQYTFLGELLSKYNTFLGELTSSTPIEVPLCTRIHVKNVFISTMQISYKE